MSSILKRLLPVLLLAAGLLAVPSGAVAPAAAQELNTLNITTTANCRYGVVDVKSRFRIRQSSSSGLFTYRYIPRYGNNVGVRWSAWYGPFHMTAPVAYDLARYTTYVHGVTHVNVPVYRWNRTYQRWDLFALDRVTCRT